MPNYTLPDGETVKNTLGAQSHDALEEREVDFARARQNQHRLDPRIPRTFDAAHLKGLHRQFFQDVYEWAGHTRDGKIKLSDGTIATEPLLYRPGSKAFAAGAEISEGLEALSTRLKAQDYLRGLSRTEFALRAATTLAAINAIHPFRVMLNWKSILRDQVGKPMHLRPSRRPEVHFRALCLLSCCCHSSALRFSAKKDGYGAGVSFGLSGALLRGRRFRLSTAAGPTV